MRTSSPFRIWHWLSIMGVVLLLCLSLFAVAKGKGPLGKSSNSAVKQKQPQAPPNGDQKASQKSDTFGKLRTSPQKPANQPPQVQQQPALSSSPSSSSNEVNDQERDAEGPTTFAGSPNGSTGSEPIPWASFLPMRV